MPSLSRHWLNGGMLQPVVVLAGGLSHQRDISLKSGRIQPRPRRTLTQAAPTLLPLSYRYREGRLCHHCPGTG